MAVPLRTVLHPTSTAPGTPALPPSAPLPPPSMPTWAAWPRQFALPQQIPVAYAAAVAASVAATLTAWALGLGSEPGVFAPFFVALVAVALRWGLGPALVTIATSMVAAYVWLLAPLM